MLAFKNVVSFVGDLPYGKIGCVWSRTLRKWKSKNLFRVGLNDPCRALLADTLLLVGVLTPKSEIYESKSRRMCHISKLFAMSSSENFKYGISMFGRDFSWTDLWLDREACIWGTGKPFAYEDVKPPRRAATNGSILRREFPNI